jgi:hypothetical protein
LYLLYYESRCAPAQHMAARMKPCVLSGCGQRHATDEGHSDSGRNGVGMHGGFGALGHDIPTTVGMGRVSRPWFAQDRTHHVYCPLVPLMADGRLFLIHMRPESGWIGYRHVILSFGFFILCDFMCVV